MTLSFLTVDTFDILVLDVTKYLKYELESAPGLLTQNVLTAPSWRVFVHSKTHTKPLMSLMSQSFDPLRQTFLCHDHSYCVYQ